MAATPAQLEALARGRAARQKQYAEQRAEKAAAKKVKRVSQAPDDVTFVDELPQDNKDKAPKPRDATQSRGPGRPAGFSPKTASVTKIRQGLVMMFTAAGMGISVLDTYDGTVIARNAERLADAWSEVAAQNPRVRKVLEALLEGSVIGNAMLTTAMVFVPIAVHHGAAGPSLLQMAETMGVDTGDERSATAQRPVAPVSDPIRTGPDSTGATVRPPVANGADPATNGATAAPSPGGADIPLQSFEDGGFPAYSGPPDRVS